MGEEQALYHTESGDE